MTYKLRFKLTTAFISLVLAAFLLFGIFANLILENQFRQYVLKNISNTTSGIVSELESSYTASGGWNLTGLETIGMNALGDGLIIRVTDSTDNVLWDARTHNSGMCTALLQEMAGNMERYSAGFSGGYTEKSFDLTFNGGGVGTVVIGYYGPYFYTDNDLQYLQTLNKLLILATALSCLFALLLGTYFAKRLSAPISQVIGTALEITEGNYGTRVELKSKTTEIVELTCAINTLAEKLGRQEALRKRLTADVAHELRTPIANLQSHLEAMLDGIWAADTTRLQSLHEEIIRLSKIVSDLETLARYDKDRISLNRERFDLSTVVRKAAASFDNALLKQDIELITELPESFIDADMDRITQVLTNLLSNAIKFTPGGGRIQLTLTGDDSTAVLSVKDNGIGISDEDLPSIFERFYRADTSRSRDSGGSGIGLAIVKSIIDAHGGTITALSTPGFGSEFIVTLPRHTPGQ